LQELVVKAPSVQADESLKKLQAEQEQDPKFVEFLRQFGQHLKDAFGGWSVFVLTADMALPGQLRIKEAKGTLYSMAPWSVRLFKFEMHQKRPAMKSKSDEENERCEMIKAL
jgi:putative N6-adenine-specific DNA methylase